MNLSKISDWHNQYRYRFPVPVLVYPEKQVGLNDYRTILQQVRELVN